MSNIQWADSFTEEAAQDAYEQSQEGVGGKDFVTLKEGDNWLRVLPPLPGTNPFTMRDGRVVEAPFVIAYQHRIELPDGTISNINCPRLMHRQTCLVCAEMEKLRRSGNPGDRKRSDGWFPRFRSFWNVIDRTEEDFGPKILGAGKKIHDGIMVHFDPKKGGKMFHPETGFDICIERTGQKLQTKYNVTAARDNTPLGNDEWISMQHDLSRHVELMDDADMQAKLADLQAALGIGAPPVQRGAPPVPRQALPVGRQPVAQPSRPAAPPVSRTPPAAPRAPAAPPRAPSKRAQDMAMPDDKEGQ